ncbi:MAG: DUF3040 domain-containing protein [Jatrophihabitans sp.]
MPLSEHEQRLLEQIEQGLYAEDPKFAASVRRVRARSGTRRRIILAVIGVVVGLGVVLLALTTKLIILGVVGFLLIVGACFYALVGLTDRSVTGPAGVVDPDGSTKSRRSSTGGIKDRMEGRIRRRFDEE